MLSVQPVSVYRPSFERSNYDDRAYKDELSEKLEENEAFFENQKHIYGSVANNNSAVGKFAKTMFKIMGAVIAGIGMAYASNLSINLLKSAVKYVKLDKAAKFIGKKIGAGFKFTGKQIKKAAAWTAKSKAGQKAGNLTDKYKKTKLAKKLTDFGTWIKKQKFYNTVSEKVSKFNSKAIDSVGNITGKKVQTATANIFGVASGATFLLGSNNRSSD